jgi:diacylglycerol kinase
MALKLDHPAHLTEGVTMTLNVEPRRRSWARTFRCAARGMIWGFRSQRNFAVHLTVALAVVAAAMLLGATVIQWCLLVLSIATVLAAELFNTAIEHLARAITREENDEVRDALDTAGGAVLLISIGAAAVGGLIFVRLLGEALGWWNR